MSDIWHYVTNENTLNVYERFVSLSVSQLYVNIRYNTTLMCCLLVLTSYKYTLKHNMFLLSNKYPGPRETANSKRPLGWLFTLGPTSFDIVSNAFRHKSHGYSVAVIDYSGNAIYSVHYRMAPFGHQKDETGC